MTELLLNLAKAVERAAGAGATHKETNVITLKLDDRLGWEGIVETFAVAAQPGFDAYGWAVMKGTGVNLVVVLGKPPIVSPSTAVEAWLRKQPAGFPNS